MSLGSFLGKVGKGLANIGGSVLDSVTGGLASGITSGIGSFVGNSVSLAQQAKYQKDLMQQQKQNNMDLAQQSADLNFGNWQKQNNIQNSQLRQNALDSAQLEAQGRKAAGMSAIDGSGSPTLVGAPSSGGSLGSFASSGIASAPNVDNPMDNLLKQKQADLLDAQRSKLNKEADILDVQLGTEEDLRNSMVEVNKALAADKQINVKLGEQTYDFRRDMLPKELDKADAMIKQFMATANNLNMLTAKYGQERNLLVKENQVFFDRFETSKREILAQAKYYSEQANLSYAQGVDLARTLQSRLDVYHNQCKSLDSDSKLKDATTTITDIQYDLIKEFGPTERVVGLIKDITLSVGAAMLGAKNLKGVIEP